MIFYIQVSISLNIHILITNTSNLYSLNMILKEDKNILPINHRELEFQYIGNKAKHKIVTFNIVVALLNLSQ